MISFLTNFFNTCREDEEQIQAYRQLKRTIEEHYKPLHRHIYQLEGWEVVPSFREAVVSGSEERMRSILTEEIPGWLAYERSI